MKKVFSSNWECIHVFCQGEQNEGRSSSVFFENGILYSYGRHYELAKFVLIKGVKTLLLNTNNWSNSTSKHQHLTRNSANKYSYSIESLDFGCFKEKSIFSEFNTLNAHKNNVRFYFERCQKSRLMKNWYGLKKHLKDYSKACGILEVWPENLIDENQFSEVSIKFEALEKMYSERNKKREAAEIERIKKEREIDLLELPEKLELWRKGSYNGTLRGLENPALRLTKDKKSIQTSLGALVPLDAARALLLAIRSGIDVKGQRIGHYTVNYVSLDSVIIGCHTLQWSEINLIGDSLRW